MLIQAKHALTDRTHCYALEEIFEDVPWTKLTSPRSGRGGRCGRRTTTRTTVLRPAAN